MVRRHFFLFAALGVVALMLVAGGVKLAVSVFARAQAESAGAGSRGGVLVSQTRATLRPFTDRIEVLGVAKGRQSVTITSNTTELITGVHFKDGARVAKGQVLVDLKSQEQSANIAQTEASLNLAQLNYDRWKRLGEQGIASSASVDQYRVAYEQAKANLDAAKSRMGDRVIRAPFSGVVGLSDVAPGTLINPGAPIVSLDDVAVIRVDFDVPDRFLPVLRAGMPITARPDAYPEMVASGRIAMLDTRVDEKTRAIKARAEFPNTDGRLKPGMLMRVAIDQGQRQSVAVPEAAVQYEGDLAYVFVLTNQGGRRIAEQRQVQTGADDAGFIEIKSGLKAGEAVVADGVNRVSPNQAVRVAGAGGAAGRGR